MSNFNEQELFDLEEELKPSLQRYLVKSPKTEETKRLIQGLQSEFNHLKQNKPILESVAEPFLAKSQRPSLWKQCWYQMKTYQKGYWIVSLAVFIMLSLISSDFYRMGNQFSLLTPLFLLASFLYSYRSWNPEMRMVESVTPFPPTLLLLSRFLLVLINVLILGMIGTVFLYFNVYAFHWLPFLLSWLSSLIFVGGVLAYGMFWKGVKQGIILALLAWALYNAGTDWLLLNGLDHVVRLEILLPIQVSLLLLGLLLIGFAYRRSIKAKI